MSQLSGEAALDIIRENQQLPPEHPARIALGGRVQEHFPFFDDLNAPFDQAVPEAHTILARLGQLGSASKLLDPEWLDNQVPRVAEMQALLGKACYRAVGQETLPRITEVDTEQLGLVFTAEALATGALLDLVPPVYKDPSLAVSTETVAGIINRHPGFKTSYYRSIIGRYAYRIRDIDSAFGYPSGRRFGL